MDWAEFRPEISVMQLPLRLQEPQVTWTTTSALEQMQH